MIQLQDVRNAFEPLLEVANLLECITEFDDWGLVEHALGVHDEFSMLEGVQVGGDEEEVRG